MTIMKEILNGPSENEVSPKKLAALSSRMSGVEEYYFSTKLREIAEMNEEGKNVLNLGIGSPDLPPHPDVVKVLAEESLNPRSHGYQSYKGSPVLRKAASEWYQKYYNVTLDPATEILPLIGSKEGIMHICMTYLEKGDEVLVPDPGYPAYASAVKMAGANMQAYTLTRENNFFPDFTELESRDLSKVKLMFVNYPHMPTGTLPTLSLFEHLISFATKHQILICHDNPYSFILNNAPMSLLSVEGAREVVIELNSLSKSHCMAGWRVGFLSGAKARIDEVMRFKSNMDSGMFLPLQLAAAKALSLGEEWFQSLNNVYRRRRDLVFQIMDVLHCKYEKNQAGLFVWAQVASSFKNGWEMCDTLLYKCNVFITPGGIFGKAADEYIRISLCTNEENLKEVLERIKTANLNFEAK